MSNRETSPDASSTKRQGFWTCWKNFWFLPRQTLGLHAVRMIFGILLLCWLLPFAGYVNDFFGLNGWFDTAAYAEASKAGRELIDSKSWSLLYLVANNPGALHAVYWGSVAVLVLFTLGLFTRITAVLTWLIVVSFTANPLIEVDTDVFFRLIAFYLMVAYLVIDWLRTDLNEVQKIFTPFQHSVVAMFKSQESTPRSSAATVTLRLLQVHFALAVVMMGLHKLQVAEWWGGFTFWYPLHRPSQTTAEAIIDFRARPVSYSDFIGGLIGLIAACYLFISTYSKGSYWETRDWLFRWSLRVVALIMVSWIVFGIFPRMGPDTYLHTISLVAYVVLAWQIFFPTFAWRGGLCRWVLLGGALLGGIGLIAIYPIPLLGEAFALLCLTYLTDFEWFALFSPLRRLMRT
ncbi:MAG TPA: hypothetical protein PLN21_16275 [Gemmatales bacterium]|nr:hypothetical protein [Gemmatales bacterium]